MTLPNDPILFETYAIEQKLQAAIKQLAASVEKKKPEDIKTKLTQVIDTISYYHGKIRGRDDYTEYRPDEINTRDRFNQKIAETRSELITIVDQQIRKGNNESAVDFLKHCIDNSFELSNGNGNGYKCERDILEKPYEDFRKAFTACARHGSVRDIIELYRKTCVEVFNHYGFNTVGLINDALVAAVDEAQFSVAKTLIVNLGADPNAVSQKQLEEVVQRPGGMNTAVLVETSQHTGNHWVPGQMEVTKKPVGLEFK